MSVRYFYVDESWDDTKFCLTALTIRDADWHACLKLIQDHRRNLRDDYEMYVTKEIHARDLVAGRGNIGKKIIPKHIRAKIFKGLLQVIAAMPKVRLFNVCLPWHGKKDTEAKAWNRLLNRIQRTMLEAENLEITSRKKLLSQLPFSTSEEVVSKLEQKLSFAPRAMIISDEGSEIEITRIFRKMTVFNPIPSNVGSWPDGKASKNIPLEKIVEDPVFRNSQRSLLIQLADCAAFALLKREVPPTPNIKKYGIHKAFDEYLAGICFRPASPSDPLGIVRK